jgi:hypothetical protein
MSLDGARSDRNAFVAILKLIVRADEGLSAFLRLVVSGITRRRTGRPSQKSPPLP